MKRLRAERNQRDTELVSATAQENMWAGVGAAVLTLSAQIAWRLNVGLPVLLEVALGWSLLAGLSLFGVLSIIRFSLDEWRDSLERLRMMGVLTELQADNARLTALVAEQGAELTRLRQRVRGQEFKEAAKDARSVVTPDETDTAKRLRNAERIVERWSNNHPYSREAVQMSRQEWESAMALLQSAGVVGRGGPGGRQMVITARSQAEALNQLRNRGRVWEQAEGTNFVVA